MVMRWEEMIPGALFLGWGILWVIMITAFWLLVLLGLALAVRWLWRAGSGIKIPAPQGSRPLRSSSSATRRAKLRRRSMRPRSAT